MTRNVKKWQRRYQNQARKKSTKTNFLAPETGRWGGGLPRGGVVAKNFVPALESLSSLGFEERNLGCPGIFAGMSRTPGGVQKVCAKKLRAHFSFPTKSDRNKKIGHFLTGGGRNGGYATSARQECAQKRATQMTHMPSLKPLCLLCQNQGSLRHRRVICLSQRRKSTPPLVPPHLEVTKTGKRWPIPFCLPLLRHIEQPEVSKRGWRTKGIGAKKSFLCQRLRPLFCTLFPMPLEEKGDKFLENLFAGFFGFVSRQPPPANPFSKPLKKKLRK